MLTEAQVIALEKAKTEKEAHGEFESEHPGYCGAQDTFKVGNLKGVEGMLAAQLIACHHASMDCYRLAMHREQTFEGTREYLTQANKLSRTYATLLESLNRHRGKGQQKVTVEHVHVHEGGQAIVGNVEAGGGVAIKSKEQPPAITYAPGQAIPSTDATRDRVPIARDEERSLPDARRNVSGGTEGE